MADQGLLDAVAQAGTRGAEDYKNAQAQLAGQQQEATRLALASGVNNGMPPGAQAVIANIIAQGYQPRAAQMTSNAATMGDYYNRIGTNAKVYGSQVDALIPAINQQFENQLALKMASGGGGSGGSRGGGGGGKAKAPVDDFSQLLKDYHGVTNLKLAIPQLARAAGVESGDYASQLGVPPELAQAWFPSYATKSQTALQKALASNPRPTVQQFRQGAKQVARATPGNQLAQRHQIVQQYKQQVQQKAKKKGR